MEHHEKPEIREQLPEAVTNFCERMEGSDYWTFLRQKAAQLKGKVVASSCGGSSGYILYFDDGSFAVCNLEGTRMEMKTGIGEPSEEELALINSCTSGNASSPLMFDRPYADEPCRIAEEVRKCHGQPITGIARGENSFNPCFPDDMELDGMIVPDREGKPSLRVFWEQW